MATGNPYVPVTITGYNVTPPTDGGEQTAANTVEWAKHKTKLGDPIKTGVDSTQTAIIAALDQRLLNSIDAKTGNYTVVAGDRGKILNFTGGSASTFTLLAAATAKLGFELVVRNFGTAVLTVDGNAAETVDGLATIDLYPGQKIFMVCDGTNWLTASGGPVPGVLAKTNTDSPYTVLVDDNGRMIDVDASGGAVTINLPAAATAKNGFSLTIKKTDSSANAVTIDADGTETIDGQLTLAISAQYGFAELFCDGTEWFLGGVVSSLSSGTNQVTTSGTAFDFTGIPSGTLRVSVVFDEVSLSATDDIIVQLGDAGGFETSGYLSTSGVFTNSSQGVSSSTAGFVIRLSAATAICSGILTLILADTANNTWIGSESHKTVSSTLGTGGGSKSLSAELTQIRVTRTGTNTFDAGSVNILIG